MASRVAIRTARPISPLATYLAAHFAKSLIWHSSILLFAFYLTETCGVAPPLAGAMLGASLVINGLADLAIGAAKDRSIADATAAIRFQRSGALLVAGGFALFCSAALMPGAYRVPVAIAALIVFRIGYPTVDVAQNALLSLNGCGEQERFALVAWRTMTSGAAILAVATLIAPALVLDPHAAPLRFAVVGAILATLLIGASHALKPDPRPGAGPLQPRPVTAIATDPGFIVVLILVVLTGVSGTLFGKLEAYFGAFGGGGGGGGASLTLMIAVATGNLLSQPLWLIVQRRCGTTTTLIASALVTIAAGGVFLMSVDPATVLPIGLGMGIGAGGSGLSLWGIVAARGARDRPMLRFGAFTCVSKLAQGAGAALLGALLGGVDYRHVMAMPGNRLVTVMALAPMLAALASIALVMLARRHLK